MSEIPFVTASRDALAEALCDSMCHHELGYGECRKKADRLIASGVVRAVDTLADDGTVVDRFIAALGQWPANDGLRDTTRRVARTYLRALTEALGVRGR